MEQEQLRASLFASDALKEMTLTFEGVDLPIKVREMSWSQRNKILSNCFVFHPDGSVGFDLDRYKKDTLKTLIVEAPWGKTDDVFLTQVKSSFGAMLDALVPKIEEKMKPTDFFAKEQDKS